MATLYIKDRVPVNEFSRSQCVLCRKDLLVTSIVILKASYVLYESDVGFFCFFFFLGGGGGGICGNKRRILELGVKKHGFKGVFFRHKKFF